MVEKLEDWNTGRPERFQKYCKKGFTLEGVLIKDTCKYQWKQRPRFRNPAA